ncbi:SDR family oxidoreductase [Pleurocapsales cyanobacterium LEGE 06147]|nr:SDR family oxidoreductase [Pleurocapsales cyanobacterium LEGE 06147]
MLLSNQKVVIIGGTSGIGLALARLAVESEAEIVIASRSQEKLEKAKQEFGDAVEGLVVDVTDEKSVKSFFNQVGRFNHLATTVGEPVVFANFLESEILQVKQALNVKFWGQYLCVKYAAPHIHSTGSITLMSGSGGPGKGVSALACTNAAVEALSRCLAVELAPIRINVIKPGMIDTPLWRKFSDSERNTMYQQVGQELLVGRIGKPEEVAQTYLYLMTNGFISGTSITVDGGTSNR